MANGIKNKRLYEEQIVRQIAISLITDAINKEINVDDVKDYVRDNFDKIVKKIVHA
jgi:hypothetical protein